MKIKSTLIMVLCVCTQLSGCIGNGLNPKLMLSSIPNSSNSSTPTSNPIPAHFTTGQSAAFVIGQSIFTTQVSGSTQAAFNGATGVSYDESNKLLFTTDYSNNRVIVTDLSAGITNGINAVKVLGQSNFTNNSSVSATNSSMSIPYATVYDSVHKRLFVADSGNNRVLVYDFSNGITNGMAATYVIGQSNFTNSAGALTQSGMGEPVGLAYDSGSQYLFVSDVGGGRILIYDLSGGISNGMNATYVIGQANFTTHSASVNQSTLNIQEGSINYNSTTKMLYVADGANNRVMIFDLSSGITNGMAASHVLGQSVFTTSSSGTSSTQLGAPTGVLYEPLSKQLFVVESMNSRVMIFDLSNGITNGMAALEVLGQTDFTSLGYGTTQTNFSGPYGITYDQWTGHLFVGDYTNNRVMIFQSL